MAKRGQGEGSISKRPDGTWWARITVGRTDNGKQKRKAFYGKTRREVQEKLTAAVNEINNNSYIECSKMTVEQWLKFWLHEYKKRVLKPSTFAKYYSKIGQINPHIGNIKLKDLRREHVQQLVNGMADKKAAATVTDTYKILKWSLNKAVDDNLIRTNPCSKVVLPKNDKVLPRVLSSAEQEEFERIANQSYHGKGLIILVYTGLRIGELIGLTWNHVDFENETIRIEQSVTESMNYDGDKPKVEKFVGTPKTRASIRTIPLVPKVLEIFRELKEDYPFSKEYVFAQPDGSIARYVPFYSLTKTIGKEMKIDGLHPHCLRHTFATRCLERGINLKVAQELLGHYSIKITADMYTQATSDVKKELIMKLAN